MVEDDINVLMVLIDISVEESKLVELLSDIEKIELTFIAELSE